MAGNCGELPMVATGWPAGKSTVRFSRLSVTSVPLQVLRRGIVRGKLWLPACDSTVERLPCCSRLFLGLEELQCHLPHMPFDPD